MDSAESVAAYAAMNFTAVDTVFVNDFLAAHGPCRGGVILDVGTGPAQLPIRLCRADSAARILGLDLSEAMHAFGRSNVAAADLGERIRCVLGDAKCVVATDQSFEAVISNGTLHHLVDSTPVIAEMVRLVAPGGTLLIRDLLRPSSLEALHALVALHAEEESQAGQAIFAESLHAALTLEEIGDCVAAAGLPRDSVAVTSDRHWTCIWHKRPALGT